MAEGAEPLRVLHVEDNPDDARLIERSLRKGGFAPEVQRVECADSFQRALREGGWDLILADYNLPTFSGTAALELYREAALDTPFILISGTVGEDVAVEVMRAGAHDYLLKDSLDRLVPAIRRELRETTLRSERRQAIESIVRRERWLREANDALASLVRQPVFSGDDLDTAMRAVTETAARVFNVGRASIWDVLNAPPFLRCRDLYLAQGAAHEAGIRIPIADHPAYFDALAHNRCLAASDAVTDPRTANFAEGYLKPLGITSMLDAAIVSGGRVIGVICIEHIGPQRIWTDEEQTFAGSLADLVALVFEAAERRRAEAEARSFEGQLYQSQKLEAIGTLAGGIAHDFNNVLFAILGHAELAERRLTPENPVRHHLAQIIRAGQRARDLVRQILTFSRQRPQERNPVSLSAVLTEAGQLLRASLPAAIEMRIESAGPGTVILGDASQLHQVIVNLATNAAHAMQPRGGLLRMKCELLQLDVAAARALPPLAPGWHARLTVADNGCGMDEQVQSRIFEPFFTTKPQGEGTGLGLSVVHGIVSAHGGHIGVHSQPGAGTTFELTFPLATHDEPEPIGSVADLPRGRGERVFCLDDELANAELAAEMLTTLGYVTTVESDPAVALGRFRENPQGWDLVVVDYQMPRLSGVEVCAALHAIRRDVPVLLVTGSSGAPSDEAAVALGFKGVLGKPFELEAFARSVREALRR